MTYQVLARRFRPQRFEDLVGQEVVVRTLRNSLTTGEVAHAYIFAGLRGVGKTTAARLLAKALNCESGPTPEPCGTCDACREVASGSSLDVLEIDAASNRGIDDVRELREVARVLPVRDRYRVFILDEAHQLSRDAFNALLKILEEPPAHVVFVLASTDKQKFPATVLSRCQQLDFRPVPPDVIASHLQAVAGADGMPLGDGAAQLLARAAEGSVRDALSLLDRVRAFSTGGVDEAAVAEVLGLPPLEMVMQLWDALFAGDVGEALRLHREREAVGGDPTAVFEALIQLLHSLLLLSCDAKAPIPYPAGQRAALCERAAAAGTPALVRLLGVALEQRRLVAGADRPSVAVAVALGRLTMWPRVRKVEELLAGTGTSGGGGTPPPPSRREGRERPQSSPQRAAARDTRTRLAGALDELGAHMLAARVGQAHRVEVRDRSLVLEFHGTSEAKVRSVRDAAEQVAAAARSIGLPDEVRVECNGSGPEDAEGDSLRSRVEADEGVRRVVEIFGGRVERVEEKP